MDESIKTLLTVGITICTIFLTKFLDDYLNSRKEKRDFKQKIKLKELDEIENIFNKISMYYELFSSYYSKEYKQDKLKSLLEEEFDLLSKCHKYSELVQPIRDILHLFKLISSNNVQIEDRDELNNKFKEIKIIIEKLKQNL